MLSHANLLANIRAIGRVIDASSADVFVSWLPLYHDMGLIGAWLGCLYYGAPLYAMSPLSFLARPQSWLRAIHRFRGTISAAPNFAFELCLNKIDDAELDGLDLRSLRYVGNGAEPVSVDTMRRFIDRFARYGFRPGAMAPVYGLAENAVAVTLPPPGRPPIVDRVDRTALNAHGIAEIARPDDANAVELVACGQPIPGHEIRIIDEMGRELGERREGRLEFRGPSATSGYFQNADQDPRAVPRRLARYRRPRLYGRAATCSSPAGSRTSSSVPASTSRRTRSKRRSEQSPACARTASRPSASPIRLPAPSASWCWPRRTKAIRPRRPTLKIRAQEIATHIVGGPPDEVVLVAARRGAEDPERQDPAGGGQGPLPGQEPGGAAARALVAACAPELRGARRCACRNGVVAPAQVLYAAWWWMVIAIGFPAGWLAVDDAAAARVAMGRDPRGCANRAGGAQGSGLGDAASIASRAAAPCWRSTTRATWTPSSWRRSCPANPTYVAKKELARQVFAGAAAAAAGRPVSGAVRSGRQPRRPRKRVGSGAGSGACSCSFRRARSRAGRAFPASISAPSRSPRRPSCRWCRPSCGARVRCCGASSGFPRWSPISVSIAEPDSRRRAPISPRSCGCAIRCALSILAGCGEPDLGELIKPSQPDAG